VGDGKEDHMVPSTIDPGRDGPGANPASRPGPTARPGLPAGLRGAHGWAGNAGTLFWIDPKELLMAIYMVQVRDPDRIALRNQFRTMVQSAIID
jgi:CubicO group peptidase (beta-lactamase class C family)